MVTVGMQLSRYMISRTGQFPHTIKTMWLSFFHSDEVFVPRSYSFSRITNAKTVVVLGNR